MKHTKESEYGMPFFKTTGLMLRAQRERIGFSPSQVRTWTGINRDDLSKIECGESQIDYEELYLLSKLYGTSVSCLIYPDMESISRLGDGEKPSKSEIDRAMLKAKLRYLSEEQKIFMKNTLEGLHALKTTASDDDNEKEAAKNGKSAKSRKGNF